MPTNQQRRDAERRRLQRQLEERRAREVARKRRTLIISVAATIVVIVGVIVAVVIGSGSDDKSSPTASKAGPDTVRFAGVTVSGATDLTKKPTIAAQGGSDPAKVQYKDLVVGRGKAASPTSNVTVQYVGVLYKTGAEFDSSWKSGAPVPFSLKEVVPGFTQGIGGTTGIPPMKTGGRRLIIMPSKFGYGASGQGSDIPPNAPLVFVVDLTKVS